MNICSFLENFISSDYSIQYANMRSPVKISCLNVLSLLLLQVMMMVLPLLIIVLLPKVVNTNDPEMRKVNNLL